MFTRHKNSRRVRDGVPKTAEVAPTSAAALQTSSDETSIEKVPFGQDQSLGQEVGFGKEVGKFSVVILT